MPDAIGSKDAPSNRKPLFKKSHTKTPTQVTHQPPILDGFACTYFLHQENSVWEDLRTWLQAKPDPASGVTGQRLKSNTYRLGRAFRSQPGASPVVIQCDPYLASHSFLRIEFNPSKQDTLQCFTDEIKPILQMILHGCLDDFLSPGYLRVTDIAFAQDFQGLYPHQFLVAGKSEAIKQFQTYTDGKQTESVYAGSDKSQNQYLIYDKAAEMKKKTGKIIPQTTRFEHAYKPEGGVSFDKLYQAKIFKGLSVSSFPNAINLPPEVHPGDFACILDAVQIHGIPKVLSRYQGDKKRRMLIKKLLTSVHPEWWNPDPTDFHQPLNQLASLLFEGV